MDERRAPVLLPRTKSIKAVVAKQYQALAKTYPSLPTTSTASWRQRQMDLVDEVSSRLRREIAGKTEMVRRMEAAIQSSEDATELDVANLIEADIVQLQRDESKLRGLEVELRRRFSLASQRIQLHADVDALETTNHRLAAILAAMQTVNFL
ncbi:hypothetical protein DYB34_002713 [Aphanomyces astaci]|uniref:Uncharacterized protein n=1 Tax=Aphanomyces astaci TaxID=112090 RepID=A0A3R6VYB7_APHAT|nr:hypothetical protein DYB34_002713 [Aphanomyces astaci]